MVLIINEQSQNEFPKSTAHFYKKFLSYKDGAKIFLENGIRKVGAKGALYVGQREVAATVPEDANVSMIGSDDATTCIIVILRHSVSGAVALAHFDGSDIPASVLLMIHRLEELSQRYCEGRIELQLIGGFSDDRYTSEEIFVSTMMAFQKHPKKIHVKLVCVGDLNTEVKDDISWPIIYGVGVEIKTGDTFPATFLERGPDEYPRNARVYNEGKIMEIYNCKTGILKIGPFGYQLSMNIKFLLDYDDKSLLDTLSTSPLVEPPHLVAVIRNTLKFMQEHPNPYETVFKNGQPHFFKRNEDCTSWVPIQI